MFLFSISWESEPSLGELDVVGRNGGQGGALLLEEITWGNNLNITIIVVIVIVQNHYHLGEVDGGRTLKCVEVGRDLSVWVQL